MMNLVAKRNDPDDLEKSARSDFHDGTQREFLV